MTEYFEYSPEMESAPVAVKLIRQVIDSSDDDWDFVLKYRQELETFFIRIGVQLAVDEKNGYAYLKQPETDFHSIKVTRFFKRISLSYEVTLLITALKEILKEHEAEDPEFSSSCFMKTDEIKVFLEKHFRDSDEEYLLLTDELEKHLDRASELKFIKKTEDEDSWEITRLINARFDLDAEDDYTAYSEALLDNMEPYAPVIIRLFRGTIYRDEKLWDELVLYRDSITRYLASIGLEPFIDEADGYAFIRQTRESKQLPFVDKISISYDVALLLVVLRGYLDEFDITDMESGQCIISESAIKDQVEFFFRNRNNRVKLLEGLERHIKRAEDLGFLKQVNAIKTRDKFYEIKRVIRSRIDIEKLEEIKKRLSTIGTI